jgi:hypothetical protein
MADFMLTWIGKKYITRTILYLDSFSIQDTDHHMSCAVTERKEAITMGDLGVPKGGRIGPKKGAVKPGAKKGGAKKAGAKKTGAKKGGKRR